MILFFLNARYAASASNLKKGSGSSSEKAKPLKYLHVTSVQGELQLTMSGASNPHYQLCKDKAVVTRTGFWRSQTLFFTCEILCYQTEKAKSKNEFSWREIPHLSMMFSLSKALLSQRDFIFSVKAQICSQ